MKFYFNTFINDRQMRTIKHIATFLIFLLQCCLAFQTKAQDTLFMTADSLLLIEINPQLGRTIEAAELKKYHIIATRIGLTNRKGFYNGTAFSSAQILQKTDSTCISRVLLANGITIDYPMNKGDIKRFNDMFFPVVVTHDDEKGKGRAITVGIVMASFVGLALALSLSQSTGFLF